MPKRKKSPPLTKEQFLARVMSREEPDREKIIKDILEELHAFEMKYRMRSEIFFKFIVGTPLEDQPDFLDWGMCYREYLQIFQTQFSPEKIAADVLG